MSAPVTDKHREQYVAEILQRRLGVDSESKFLDIAIAQAIADAERRGREAEIREAAKEVRDFSAQIERQRALTLQAEHERDLLYEKLRWKLDGDTPAMETLPPADGVAFLCPCLATLQLRLGTKQTCTCGKTWEVQGDWMRNFKVVQR